jgi:hypothetical protein
VEKESEAGEIKQQASDARSIFEMDGIVIAVEICLDHRRGRLREARSRSAAGQSGVCDFPIDVQLVPSCGMQIQQPSVVARPGGIVFNCDGQYSKRDVKATPDDATSIFTGTRDGKGHTQLAVVVTEAMGEKGLSDEPQLQRPGNTHVITAPLDVPRDVTVSQTEAYGAGEVHLYSKVALPSK